MSLRREREHVSLPLNAVAVGFAVSSLHHKNRLNFCVRAHPPVFYFCFVREICLARSTLQHATRRRDQSTSQRVVSHLYLAKAGLARRPRFWSAVLTHDPSQTKCSWHWTAAVAINANAPHKSEVGAVLRNAHEVVLRWCDQMKGDCHLKTRSSYSRMEGASLRTKIQTKNLSPSFWLSCAFSLRHVRIRPQRDDVARKHQCGPRDGNVVLSGSDTACAHLDGSRCRNMHSGVQT